MRNVPRKPSFVQGAQLVDRCKSLLQGIPAAHPSCRPEHHHPQLSKHTVPDGTRCASTTNSRKEDGYMTMGARTVPKKHRYTTWREARDLPPCIGGWGPKGSSDRTKGAPVWVYLDAVATVRNVGSVLNTCSALGVAGVLLSRHGSPGPTASLSSASNGALECMQNVFFVTNGARFLRTAKSNGWCVLGAANDENADTTGTGVAPGIAENPSVLVLGSEEHGISNGILAVLDKRVWVTPPRTLPPAIDSLNVGVAAGILLARLMATPILVC